MFCTAVCFSIPLYIQELFCAQYVGTTPTQIPGMAYQIPVLLSISLCFWHGNNCCAGVRWCQTFFPNFNFFPNFPNLMWCLPVFAVEMLYHMSKIATLTPGCSLSLVTETSNWMYQGEMCNANKLRGDLKQAEGRNGFFLLCQMEENELVKISRTVQMYLCNDSLYYSVMCPKLLY